MEAWLQTNGFAKESSWKGEKIKAIPHSYDGYVAPYLDGDCKHAELNGDYFYICGDGEYCMDDTGGRVSEENMAECADCDSDFPEDDGYWVGVYDDRHICSSCREDYTYAWSRGGSEYYVPDDETVCVHGDYYHTDYLSDNEIVELRNGDYAKLEDSINIDGDWYETDDEDICYAEDTEEYALKDDCWMCTHTDKWYTHAIEAIQCPNTLCQYHPDHAPEYLTTSNKE
jgi:hypothetical protein